MCCFNKFGISIIQRLVGFFSVILFFVDVILKFLNHGKLSVQHLLELLVLYVSYMRYWRAIPIITYPINLFYLFISFNQTQ